MLFNNIEQRGVTELAAVACAAARAADAMSSDQIGCVFECGPKLLRGHPPIRSPAPGEEIPGESRFAKKIIKKISEEAANGTMARLSPFREQATSALPPITDSSGTSRHVRKVPRSDITRSI
jgi:hypothetical protein